jgi:signal transduction histidine kinase/ActR/RegA family two-component response regulator
VSEHQPSLLEGRVLLLGATARDAAMTRRILGGVAVECEACRDGVALCKELERGAGALILTEEMIESAELKHLLDHLRQQPPWSDLPILLLSSGGASSPAGLRAMETLGNVTVLERPVQTSSLLSVVRTLLRARNRQYQIRSYMLVLEQAALEREQLLGSELAARSEAERVSRVKDEFLATLSHELRTPLNAILGWAQLLRRDPQRQDDLLEGLTTIERNARVQTQIIEDLLDMSRIISGRIRLDVQRVDLTHVIESALDTIKPAADAREIRIVKVLDPSAATISGDPARLQQVFWNLLSNAIKFTPRGGRIQVVLERVNSHIEISVIDTGEGISAEFLPHVFDRFRQADPSTTRRHGGLGLGLAIVKQLVELHGGSIVAKSGGLAQGATFTVSLPVTVLQLEALEPHRRHPRTIGAPPCADGHAMLKGVKVLVVDDEPDARALVKRLLEECQATVITAASAAEAIEAYRNEAPTVLISDIGMPQEDGYGLIRRIRALDNTRGKITPALALTAYARSEDRMAAIRSGYQMHIAKPVEPAELTTVVAALAGRTNVDANAADESADPAVTI